MQAIPYSTSTVAAVLIYLPPSSLANVPMTAEIYLLMFPGCMAQVSLKVAGAAICNWIMTSYYY
eukprot:456184-Pelagomonas_calceolata.AAC.4